MLYVLKFKSVSGWNLVALIVGVIPFLAAFSFFVSLADPNPKWWQWLCAFVFSGLALWIYSFPGRTVVRSQRRYLQIQRLWKVWDARLERGEVPRWEADVARQGGQAGPG